MQNEKCMDLEKVNYISELMYKIDVSCAKVEQCAFESINTTDQVMMGMQDIMELLQQILSDQAQLCSAIELCTLSLDEKEGESLAHLAGKQSEHLSKLQVQLYKVAASAAEANDAARCIEAGVAEQSENIAGLVQCSEEILSTFNE